MASDGSGYDDIYVLGYEKEKDYTGLDYDTYQIEYQNNTTSKFICSRLMNNTLNCESDTLNEALESMNYIKNECWITAIMN